MVQIVTLNNRQAWAVDDSGGRGREVLKRWEKLGNPTAAVSSSAPLRISSLGEIQSETERDQLFHHCFRGFL